MVDDDDHFTCPSIEPAVQFFCMRIIVSYLHISLHVLPCLALPSTQPFLFIPSLQCLAIATLSIIERSGEQVTEWLRQPHVLLDSFFIFDNDPLAPSLPCCFCFSSSLVLWRERCRRHCLSFFPLVPPCLISVVSCLLIVSFHG
jgi:hypothetical protein